MACAGSDGAQHVSDPCSRFCTFCRFNHDAAIVLSVFEALASKLARTFLWAGMTPEQQLNHNRQVQHLQQLLNTGNLNPQLQVVTCGVSFRPCVGGAKVQADPAGCGGTKQAAAAALMRPGAPSLATLLPQLNQPMASQALPAGWRPSASQAPGTALPVARPQMQMPNMMQQQQFQVNYPSCCAGEAGHTNQVTNWVPHLLSCAQARPSQPMPQQTFQYMQQPRPGYGQSAVPGAGVQPYNLVSAS